MAWKNISETARMAGVSRATVHRRIKDGKLSATEGKIQISEILRVWPNAKVDSKKYQTVHDATVEMDTENRLLKAENQHLKAQLAEVRESKADLQKSMLMIEHKNTKEDDERERARERAADARARSSNIIGFFVGFSALLLTASVFWFMTR